MNLYFDNASTSFPKPKNVIKSINNYISNIGASSSRGSYEKSMLSNKISFKCREKICNLLNYKESQNIVFSYNATYAFNLLLASLVNGDLFEKKPHILISKLDHNSTIRPLINLKNKKLIELDFIDCLHHYIDIDDLESKIKPSTKFLIISHMSNVLGTIQDLNKLNIICKKHNIYLIIDASQSIGLVDIDLSKINFGAIIFTGHKNLFSSQGIGGFIISNDLLKHCENHFLGGTGSESSNLLTKSNMPDYFEIGTQNMIGINSLLNGIEFIENITLKYIFEQKKQHLININNEIKNINGIIVLNNIHQKNQNSTLCINFKKISPNEVGFLLDKKYKISVRVGLHCAPYTHEIIGTFPNGCIRISPGIFNKQNDIKYLINALNEISKNS